jgi:hypothetical protein
LVTHNLRLGLAEEGKDGDARVTADDGDLVLGRVLGLAEHRGEEGRGSDNVEVGHTEQAAGEGNMSNSFICARVAPRPTHRLGSKTPAFLSVSAKTGTVELTGLEMTRMKALGQALAMAEARVAQMPALTWG